MGQHQGRRPPYVVPPHVLDADERLAEAILSASPEVLWAFDRESRYRYVSPQGALLFQLEPAAMVGRSWRELGLPDELMASFEANLHRVLHENNTVTGMMAGPVRGEHRQFEYMLTPLETTEARNGLVIANLWDVTERARIQESLHRSEQLFRRLMESAPDAILMVDAAGVITLANGQAEQLFNYSRSELIGMPVERLMPQRYRARHVKQRRRYQEHPEVRPMGIGRELYGQRKDGTKFPVEISLSPLPTPDGLVTVVIARDATARIATTHQIRELNRTLRRKVTELAAVNQELEAFSYSVSHDLRAPLRGLDGFSQALLEDYAEQLDGTAQDYLERIRAASQRMAQLIDDLLRLSRIMRAEMTIETVDLTVIASEILEECQKRAPLRQVVVRIAPDLTVQGDRRLLRVCLENLLDNAWKFTTETPRAEIEVGVEIAEQATPVYYVRDNGAGFDMAYAERLFGPFQRLHSVHEFDGNGIGLATVQRVIQRHGGRIWADAGPQRGATFYFQFG